MRRDLDGAQLGDMIGGVISLVLAHRAALAGLLGFALEHGLRSTALGRSVGNRDPAADRQSMPVLHEGMAHVGELRLPPGGLAVKAAFGIAGAGVRVILALLAVEVGAPVGIA